MTKSENQRSKLPILNRDDVKDSLDTELVFIMILSASMVFAILQLLMSRRQGFAIVGRLYIDGSNSRMSQSTTIKGTESII